MEEPMSYIFKQSDVFDFANSIGADTRQKGNELFFKLCPKCKGGGSDKDTFSVNLDTGAFKCFRASCDYHGHFVELARDFDYPLDFGEPRVYRKLPQKPIEVKPSAITYMESRGISREITERYKITARKDNPNILAFPFYDENNVLQFIKYRNTKYAKGSFGSKEWCEENTKPILFGMAQCIDFGTLIITEGQIDSLTVAECGFDNAVSVPTGALGFTWLVNCWEWITQFSDIIVFGDYEKGKMTLLDTLQARLPQRVRAVRAQDYLGEKDANAILQLYGKKAIVTAVENAEVPKMSYIKDLSTVKAVDINTLPKIKTNIKEVDRVIGGLVLGQVVLLTGKRGEGKSTFMSQLVCEALDQDYNTFIYSGELADFHFRRWLDYQLAGAQNIIEQKNVYGDAEYLLSNRVVESIGNWYKGRAFVYDNNYLPDDGEELESLTKIIELAIKQCDAKLICIDNLMTAMDVVDKQDNLYLAQSNFVGALKKIASRYNVVIILVAHPRKSNNDFTNDDVSGSSDITNKVDVVMSYKRVDDEHGSGGKLVITKNRLTGKLAVGDSAIPLLYSERTKRIFSATSSVRRYGWERTEYQDEFADIL
jgi:archaellum biogenesis ATPase FlaH